MKSLSFDRRLVPTIDRIHAWFEVPDALYNRLSQWPAVQDRADNVLRFCALLEHLPEPPPLRARGRREGYLRAALTELVSIEDLLKAMVAKGEIAAQPPRMNESKNPMLHIVRELRNLQIHLRSGKLNPQSCDMVLENAKCSAESVPMAVTIWWLDISDTEFLGLTNPKRYDVDELRWALQWFDSRQKEWGIIEMVHRALQAYLSELLVGCLK